MIFITGGKYQGKLEYAASLFDISEADIRDGAVCSIEEAFSGRVLFNLHILAARLLKNSAEAETVILKKLEENPRLEILICDELGCGVVPLDKDDRIWRETVGRISCEAARRADTVIRIICGLPQVIKGVLPKETGGRTD